MSGNAPWLVMGCKLVKYDERPVLKLRAGKISLAGEKPVFRLMDSKGQLSGDVIGLADDQLPEPRADALLETFMGEGKITKPLPSLPEIRERFQQDFSALDDRFKSLKKADKYPVRLSSRLRRLQKELERKAGTVEME